MKSAILFLLYSSLLICALGQNAATTGPSDEAATTVVSPTDSGTDDTAPFVAPVDKESLHASQNFEGHLTHDDEDEEARDQGVTRVCVPCIPNGFPSCPFKIPAGRPFMQGGTNLRFSAPPTALGCAASGPAVQFSLAPSTVGRWMTATTLHPGTTLDTVLALSTNNGASWSNCNDDISPSLQSRLNTFFVPANNANYRIAVSGWSGRVGDYMLLVTENVYFQALPSGVVPQGSSPCTNFNIFRSKINSGLVYHRLTFSSSLNQTGIVCDGLAANSLCQALRSGLGTTQFCSGATWRVGPQNQCNNGVEITTNSLCSCTAGAALRPCINNANWGGFGTTCGAAAQSFHLACY